MREWMDAVLAVLLAPTCAACRETLQRPTSGCVCSSCWNNVITPPAPVCDRCGGLLQTGTGLLWRPCCPHCADSTSHVTRARSIGPYAGALRDIVHALKYDGRRSLAKPLADRMRHAGQDLVRQADVTVPVPLHRARRRERGFNQAADLAHCIGLPVVPALSRVRATPSQTALHAEERRANVDGAFRATRRVLELRGVTVLVVDDVRTTGATLESCARVLKDAGVREVLALTAARVESPQP